MVTRNQHLDQRMNWFDRQFLRAQDFADESDYQVDRQRRHLRTLHTPGVAEGLVVRGQPGDAAVTVDPGTAIDDQGREIVLISQSPAQSLPAAATAAELYVSYTEAQTAPSQDPGISGYTRISEIPQFTFRQTAPTSQPVPASGVLLATVAISSGQLSSAPDISGQIKAGATVGDVTAFSVTLKRVGQPASAWPRLTASGPNQVSLAGDLRLTSQGTAPGALGLPGPLTLNDVALTAPGQNRLSVAGDLSLTSQGSAQGGLSLPGPLTFGGGPQLASSGPNQLTLNGDLRLARQGSASGGLTVPGSILLSGGLQFGSDAPVTAISRDGSLSGNRSNAVPTEAAVKSYADGVRSYADSIKTIAQKNLGIVSGWVVFTNNASGSYSISFPKPVLIDARDLPGTELPGHSAAAPQYLGRYRLGDGLHSALQHLGRLWRLAAHRGLARIRPASVKGNRNGRSHDGAIEPAAAGVRIRADQAQAGGGRAGLPARAAPEWSRVRSRCSRSCSPTSQLTTASWSRQTPPIH